MKTDFTEIVNAAKNGDQRAFEALYNLTKDSSYFIAFSITQNENDALDIMQDSYLKAFNGIQQLQNPNAFESWLNRIVANTAKNYIAKKKPMLFDDIGALSNEAFDETELNQDYLPEQSADSKETSRLLMGIIDKLSEEKRLCILMYYYQEMSVSEISESLQLPVSTVKYKLLAARADIKNEVEKLEKDGTKLYALFPFALFPAQFKNIEKEFAVAHTAPVYSAVLNDTAAVGITATTAVSAAKTGFFATIAGKIVIAAAALLLGGGGITAAIAVANFNRHINTAEITKTTTSVSHTTPASQNTDLLTTEQAIEKMQSVTTDEATFVLDGVIYSLPCTLQTFVDNGWVNAQGDADRLETELLWQDNNHPVQLIRNGSAYDENIDYRINVDVKNTTSDRLALKDCYVQSLYIEIPIRPPHQTNPELILNGGLMFDETITTETVLQACGAPQVQQNIYHATTRMPDVDTKYTELDYSTATIYVNSEADDDNKYNYQICKIFTKIEGEE